MEKKSKKIYKKPLKAEEETTINILHGENKFIIYTNNISFQKQLAKLFGEPFKEDKIKRSISGSTWEIPFSEKSKIRQMMLKVNIFEL